MKLFSRKPKVDPKVEQQRKMFEVIKFVPLNQQPVQASKAA